MIKYFLKLFAGFLALSGFTATLGIFFSEYINDSVGPLSMCLGAASFTYVPFALGLFFARQSGHKRWLLGSALAFAFWVAISGYLVWKFWNGGFQQYESFLPGFLTILFSCVLSLVIFIPACLSKRQHQITRRLCAAAMVTGSMVLIYLLPFLSSPEPWFHSLFTETQLYFLSLTTYLLNVIMMILWIATLISTVFLGLQNESARTG